MATFAWLILGLVLAAAYLAYVNGLRRAKRRALATGLVVAAAIYVGFAIDGGSIIWTLQEAIGLAIFGFAARLGTRRSPIWLVWGWALHPIWDGALHLQGEGSTFAPEWYVVACISFDLLVAAYIALHRREL